MILAKRDGLRDDGRMGSADEQDTRRGGTTSTRFLRLKLIIAKAEGPQGFRLPLYMLTLPLDISIFKVSVVLQSQKLRVVNKCIIVDGV